MTAPLMSVDPNAGKQVASVAAPKTSPVLNMVPNVIQSSANAVQGFKNIFSTNPAPAAPVGGVPAPIGAQPVRHIPATPVDTSTAVKTTPGSTNVAGMLQSPTYTLPSGATADASGNIVNPPSGFSIGIPSTVSSNALNPNTTMGDVYNARNSYLDAIGKLQQATQYSPEYIDALNRQNAAKIAGAKITADAYTAPTGDTQGFNNGVKDRAGALNSLDQMASAASLQVQEMIRQGNIEGAKAVIDGLSPSSVGPGSQIVDKTGQVLGGNTMGATPATINSLANTIYTNSINTGVPISYDQARTQAMSYLTGQGTNGAGGNAVTMNPANSVLANSYIDQLNRGVPIEDIRTGTGQEGKAILNIAYAQYLAQNKGYSPQQASASAKAIVDIVSQKADTERAFSAAESNFPLLLETVKKAGVNDFNSPLANKLQQALNNNLIGSGDMASYNGLITSLQQEYAQVISRGGNVTDKTRGEAANLLNGTIGYDALADLHATLQKEAKNVIGSYDTEVQKLQSTDARTLGGASTGTATGGYIDPAQASW